MQPATYPLRIFVLGCPRSGTTLLQSFLAAHPNLCSTPESHAFNLLRDRNSPYAIKNYAKFRAHMAEHHGATQFPDPSISNNEFANGFIAGMDEYARTLGRQGWVEKTPDHLFSIEAIQTYAPDARFIHILRDPLATVASLLEAAWLYPDQWGGTKTLSWAVEKWNVATETTATWAALPNHMTVCYDQLCLEPEQSLRRLCEFLQIEFTTLMQAKQNDASQLVTSDEIWKSRNTSRVEHVGHTKAYRLLRGHDRFFIHSLASTLAVSDYNAICTPYNFSAWISKAAPWQLTHGLSRRMDHFLTRRARKRLLNSAKGNKAST